MKYLSDKAVTAAQEEYDDALKQGVAEWFAMKLALERALEIDAPKAKKKEPMSQEEVGEMIVWFSIAAGLIAVFGMIMKRMSV